jgi:hypothetical protein
MYLVPISENSILEAQKNITIVCTSRCMTCEPFEEKYDAIFNLFTSFGYFENDEDNLTTLKAIKESFLNTVLQSLTL